MSQSITHIVFDIDGTLINQSSIFSAQTSAVSEYFPGVSHQEILDSFFYAHEKIVKDFFDQRSDITAHLQKMAEQLKVALSVQELESASSAWSAAYTKATENTTVYPDVKESLEALTDAGFKLFIASGNSSQNRKNLLDQHALTDFFVDIFAAQSIGFQKQDRRFWSHVMSKLQVDPAQVLVIGNQLNDDILHPSALGMKTILIDRKENLKYPVATSTATPDATVSSLLNLPFLKTHTDKIAFILQSATPGTHMDYVYEVARTLKEDKKLPLTLLLEKKSPTPQPDWVVVQRNTARFTRVIENFYTIARLRFSGHKIFYIHYSFLSLISAGIITRVFGGTIYYWNAGMPWQYKRPWFEELYQKFAYRFVDYLVTGAQALVPGYCEYYNLAPEQVVVIPNWIDISQIHIQSPVRAELRKELRIPSNAPTLLFVQKLAQRKGAHLLPDIFALIKTPDTNLIIAGDGPEEPMLKDWVEKNNLSDRVHMVGRVAREKMHALYQAADVFLLPSQEEGSPHSLIEAQAYGLPCTGFAVGGVRETAAPLLRPHFHHYPDVSLVANSVDEFLSNPDSVHSLKADLALWMQNFDKSQAVKKFLTLLTNKG